MLLGAVVFASCNDAWNDHYDDTAGGSSTGGVEEEVLDISLREFFDKNTEYNDFYNWLKEDKVDELFDRDHYMTVWAVKNDVFARDHNFGDKDSLARIYHVNYLSFPKNTLKDGLRIKAINDIYLQVNIRGNEDNGNVININNKATVLDSYQTQNGVIYILDQLLEPRMNLYDFLYSLDDDYSIIRDSIFAKNRELFDRENSTPIGVDKTGNTIYDSIFYVDNPLFEKVKFNSQFEQFTAFLPSNQIISECFEKLNSQYALMGQTFTQKDTVLAMTWIKEAMFHKGEITDFSTQDIKSAFDRIWRTTVQSVDQSDPVELSNGLLYKVTDLKIPNNVIISRIKSLVHYYEYLSEEDKAELYTIKGNVNANGESTLPVMSVLDATPAPAILPNYVVFHVSSVEDYKEEFSVEFTPLERYVEDGIYKARVMMVPPGEYDFYMGFHAQAHPFVNVYFNEDLLQSNIQASLSTPWNYDRVNETDRDLNGSAGINKWNGLGGKIGTIMIDGEDMSTFKVKVEFSKLNAIGDPKRIRIYHWALKPTANNY